MLCFATGCANLPAPQCEYKGDPIYLDKGFETRLTRPEKQQIAKHNCITDPSKPVCKLKGK